MRILWLAHFIPFPPKGGMLIRSYNLVRQLAREFSVDVIALARPDTLRGMYPSFEAGKSDAEQHLAQICRRVDLVPTRIGASAAWTRWTAARSLLPGPPYSIRWFHSRAYRKRVQEAARNDRYDWIHVDTVSLAPYVRNVSGPRLALNHHNIESDMLLRRAMQERNSLKSWYFRQEGRRLLAYEKEVVRRFDLHLACSELDRERLLAIDPELRTAIVPNGVDVDYFKPAPDQADRPKLIFVGGQGWYPNRDAMAFFATEIWPTIRARHPGAEFDLVGRGPSEDIAAVAQKDPRFKVHGFVDDIRELLCAATIYVCPVRDGGGTKLKVLDAMAMGKAIVAHPCAVEGIDLVDDESVLLADTAGDFVRQIDRLIAEPLLGERLGQAARSLAVKKYSYDSIGAAYRDLLRNAAAPAGN